MWKRIRADEIAVVQKTLSSHVVMCDHGTHLHFYVETVAEARKAWKLLSKEDLKDVLTYSIDDDYDWLMEQRFHRDLISVGWSLDWNYKEEKHEYSYEDFTISVWVDQGQVRGEVWSEGRIDVLVFTTSWYERYQPEIYLAGILPFPMPDWYRRDSLTLKLF